MKTRLVSVPQSPAYKFFLAVEKTVAQLLDRWIDEQGYENIESYRKPIESVAKKFGIKVEKMTKKPFGFVFTTEDRRRFKLSMTPTGRYSYQQVV